MTLFLTHISRRATIFKWEMEATKGSAGLKKQQEWRLFHHEILQEPNNITYRPTKLLFFFNFMDFFSTLNSLFSNKDLGGCEFLASFLLGIWRRGPTQGCVVSLPQTLTLAAISQWLNHRQFSYDVKKGIKRNSPGRRHLPCLYIRKKIEQFVGKNEAL